MKSDEILRFWEQFFTDFRVFLKNVWPLLESGGTTFKNSPSQRPLQGGLSPMCVIKSGKTIDNKRVINLAAFKGGSRTLSNIYGGAFLQI